jgi:hypothetical protein
MEINKGTTCPEDRSYQQNTSIIESIAVRFLLTSKAWFPSSAPSSSSHSENDTKEREIKGGEMKREEEEDGILTHL